MRLNTKEACDTLRLQKWGIRAQKRVGTLPESMAGESNMKERDSGLGDFGSTVETDILKGTEIDRIYKINIFFYSLSSVILCFRKWHTTAHSLHLAKGLCSR